MTKPVQPLPAAKVLEQQFLDIRCRLLDVAAVMDRIGRGDGATQLKDDHRLEKIKKGLSVLLDASSSKAEQIQKLFSLEYDASWEIPKPRY